MGPDDQAKAESPSLLYRERRITFDAIWMKSSAMQKCIERARLAAPHDVDVLILGENGTGKNLLAQAIHNASPRHGGPFVPVDVAGFQESLFVAELFGREKGARIPTPRRPVPATSSRRRGGRSSSTRSGT